MFFIETSDDRMINLERVAVIRLFKSVGYWRADEPEPVDNWGVEAVVEPGSDAATYTLFVGSKEECLRALEELKAELALKNGGRVIRRLGRVKGGGTK